MTASSQSEFATLSGGEAMIRAARANGIDTIFGIPGAQIYPLFDAMHTSPQLKTIISRHEQGAAYMAFGYAKASGRPGAFAVVPGPGVLNTASALCTAAGSSTPLLCLTGNIMSAYLGKGRGHLHELADQVGTLKSIIKDALRIEDPTTTFMQMNAAFETMQSGRPGPVSVEMCWDAMAAEHQVEVLPGIARLMQPEINLDAIAEAAKLIQSAKRPMIMVGSGAQHASMEVATLAEMLGAPVTSLRSGRGIVSEDHELGVSSAAARLLWDETDLLIGIGSRLELQYMRWGSMRVYEQKPTSGPPLIRIDIDPVELDRLQPDVEILADSMEGTSALIEAVAIRDFHRNDTARIARAKSQMRQAITEIQPQMAYLDIIRDVLPRDGYFVEELCQVGFASYYGYPVYEPRTYISAGYQGTLGFGFQTAIGAKAAMPDRAVVSITGDGGFMFGVQELATAAQFGIGLVTIVFNNSAFGNIRRDQQTRFGGRLLGADLTNPDFVKLAESFDVAGYRVDTPEALGPVLERAINDDQPAVIDVTIERGSEVSPWKYIH